MKKRLILSVLVSFSLLFSLNAKSPEFNLTIAPGIEYPLGYEYEKLGLGVDVKLSVKPISFFNVFTEFDYYSLLLQSNSSISVMNGAAGLGVNFRINDRIEMEAFGKGGVHRSYAVKSKDILQGYSFGGGISFKYKISPVFASTSNVSYSQYASKPINVFNGIGLSSGISINLTEAFGKGNKLGFELVEVDPIFPVLYSWYETNPFGSINITNTEDGEITDVKVSFYQSQFMSQPSVCQEIESISKGDTQTVELTAFFNDKILNLTEYSSTFGNVIIEYYYLGTLRQQEYPIELLICNRNAMSWDDDRRASVFVSKKDPAALYYAKKVLSAIRPYEEKSGIPINVQRAAAIFNSLDTFGINYVIDPTSSYTDNIGTSSIDFLQFPYQTLMFRGGDCDDLSILFCSIYEACGIETGFITIPGHIYMAFNSGVEEKDIGIFAKQENIFVYDGYCWIPLEITVTEAGFSKGWKIGSTQWNNAANDGTAAFYPTSISHEIYKPVSVPGAELSFEMQAEDTIVKDFIALKNILKGEFK